MSPRGVIGAILGALAAVSPPLSVAGAVHGPHDDVLVVTFTEDGIGPDILDEVGIGDATEVTPLVAEIRATEGEAAALRSTPGVVAVEAPVTYRIASVPDDPCIEGCAGLRTWYLEPLAVSPAWDRTTGAGIEIAVIDGGVELGDPDLIGKVVSEVDYLNGAPGAIGHGTAVAALAAAATDDGVGIPGVGRAAMVRSFKVVDAEGSASAVDVADAVRDATDLGADVINLSMVGPESNPVYAEINRANTLGVVVVAAAGNKTPLGGGYLPQDDSRAYPARYPGVLAVGASTPADAAADFSYRGDWVDVFAPGTELPVPSAPGSGYQRFDGTSGAAPIVSGAVALLRAALPSLTPEQVADRLRVSSVPLAGGVSGERRLHVGGLVQGHDPLGSLDAVSVGPGQVTAKGWALDPDVSESIAVHMYVDGTGYAASASTNRPDIGTLFPAYGPAHGFVTTRPAPSGHRNVCTYAINREAGANKLLGCRAVVVGGSPFGALDSARQVPGGVQVSGWSLDPDVAGPIQVHAYAGAAGVAITASRPRSDIARLFPAWGPNHGYLTTIPTSANGSTSVCTYGIDVGAGSNVVLGCRSLELRQSPFGAIDSVVRVGSTVRLRGWALDPGTGSPIAVHTYVSGGGATARTADVSRPDVGAAFPGYGAAHGYDMSVTAPSGAQVCVYGINVGAGGNALLGCRSAP